MLVEALPVHRPRVVDRDLAARPEHRRAAHPGLVRRHPRRLGLVPPEGIERLFGIAQAEDLAGAARVDHPVADDAVAVGALAGDDRIMIGKGLGRKGRSEEHTSELQSLMRISYAVFCLKKKKKTSHKLTSKK